mgnify:CR=1 FL=1
MTKNKNKTSLQSNEGLKKQQGEKKPYANPSQEHGEFGKKEKESQKHHI